jgi:hypothetical protein
MRILNGTVGDPLGGGAATHKCLVCDKPVNPFNIDATAAGGSDNISPLKGRALSPRGGGGQSGHHHKHRPASSGGIETVPLDKIRISAEVNVLRNSVSSVDVLPALSSNQGGDKVMDAAQASKLREQHKRRIRTAAGGGVNNN